MRTEGFIMLSVKYPALKCCKSKTTIDNMHSSFEILKQFSVSEEHTYLYTFVCVY